LSLSRPVRQAPDHGTAEARLSGWLSGYQPLAGIPDELIGSGGGASGHWLKFLAAMAAFEAGDFADRVTVATRRIRDAGITHRIYGENTERAWPFNPLPLILDETEWAVSNSAQVCSRLCWPISTVRRA
jgi:uncharacterized circularly permuted ATP-grasp superfamily protein